MKKDDVIKAVADRVGLSRADTRATINAFACVVVEALKAGDRVQLTGFATFWPVEVRNPTAINPRTRVLQSVPDYTKVKFRLSKNVRNYLRKDNGGAVYDVRLPAEEDRSEEHTS